MSSLAGLLQEALVDWDCHATTVADFFKQKAQVLSTLGYVHASFEAAISQREQEYPTGLQLEHIAIAIPHTYVEHVQRPFVYVNRLVDQTLSFIQMGTDDVEVLPQYVLILGIKDPKGQVALLAELMELFADETFVQRLCSVQTATAAYELLKQY